MTLVRANIEEEIEDTMTRFLSGLNPDIRDVVELQEYVELDYLLHKAVRVEQQLKRKIAVKRNSYNNFNQNWTNRSKKEGGNSSSPHGKSAVSSAETKHNSASEKELIQQFQPELDQKIQEGGRQLVQSTWKVNSVQC